MNQGLEWRSVIHKVVGLSPAWQLTIIFLENNSFYYHALLTLLSKFLNIWTFQGTKRGRKKGSQKNINLGRKRSRER